VDFLSSWQSTKTLTNSSKTAQKLLVLTSNNSIHASEFLKFSKIFFKILNHLLSLKFLNYRKPFRHETLSLSFVYPLQYSKSIIIILITTIIIIIIIKSLFNKKMVSQSYIGRYKLVTRVIQREE